jgi:hypothetical protein
MSRAARLGRGRLTTVSAIVIVIALVSGTAMSVLGQPQGTTYYACLFAGSLSQVGTTEPSNCGRGSVISWNSVGPEGVEGPRGPEGPQGDVGMTWRGAFDETESYAKNDVVFHEGSAYISMVDDNEGNDPGILVNWDMLVQAGAQGAEGPPGSGGSIAEQRCQPGLFVYGVDGNGQIMCRTVEAPPFRSDCPDPGEWDASADLSKCEYAGVNHPIVMLNGANLNNANFTGARLGGELIGATLLGAYLDGANLSGAILSNANLSYATLRGANLLQTNLSNANLTNASLTGASLLVTNFSNADLTNANLYGATFAQTAIWTGATFSNTTCPNGTNSDNNGGTCIGHLAAP